MPSDFCKALQTYLVTTLGIAAPGLPAWPGVKTLPRYLAEGFAFQGGGRVGDGSENEIFRVPLPLHYPSPPQPSP